MNKEYIIDYDMFTVEEVITIINFFKLIEKTKRQKVHKKQLLRKYKEYRNIINNIALEKKYDAMLYEKSNVSIYRTITSLK